MESKPDISALIRLFLKLGFTAFGGPAAHIAMRPDEVVERLGWLTDQQLIDAIAISNPIIPRLRQSPLAGAFLDGANVASLGLKAAVTWQLGLAAIIDPLTAVLALASIFLLFRYKINVAWLVVGGAGVGFTSAVLR